MDVIKRETICAHHLGNFDESRTVQMIHRSINL